MKALIVLGPENQGFRVGHIAVFWRAAGKKVKTALECLEEWKKFMQGSHLGGA